MNLKIKYRESFRPFAPAVLTDRVSEFFAFSGESPYMLIVAPVLESRRRPRALATSGDDLLELINQRRSDIPAVTHWDYSARLQTVDAETHPAFHEVLCAFASLTGYPVVVNTSFNVRGEPIVCTPEDAYRCFMRTDRKSTRLNSSHVRISYAVFCLKKKKSWTRFITSVICVQHHIAAHITV